MKFLASLIYLLRNARRVRRERQAQAFRVARGSR